MNMILSGYFVTLVLLLSLISLIPVISVGQDTAETTLSGQPHPNTIPYKTQRSVAQHVLAFPSYLLHWVSRPIGYGVKYTEREFPHFFEGNRGPYGFLPLIEAGGEQGFAGGILLYHDHLFFPNHRARAELLFGSKEYNEFDLKYQVPVKGLRGASLSFDAEYENDPLRTYYQNGEYLSFASEEANVEIHYEKQVNTWLHTRLNAAFKDMKIKTSSFEADSEKLIPQLLVGNNKLFSVGNRWIFNHKKDRKRTLSGTQYIVGASWTQSTVSKSLSFIEYRGEIHHFIPAPVFPDTRRLGLKAQFRKQHNLASRSIPFYALIPLAGTRSLRGFPGNRFRSQGALLLTAEYRYPVWSFLDMVLFVDNGQPFKNYSDLSFGNFYTSYGFGFHLLSKSGFAFRSEFAFSNESSQFIISITPNF